ncbi:hypothetical protein N9L68_02060 [bacterium]|nr:hypothetical protein [bacterium]
MEAGSLGRPGGSSYYGDTAWYDEHVPQIVDPSDATGVILMRMVGAMHAPTAAHTTATTMATTTAAPRHLKATTCRRRRLTNSSLASPSPGRTPRRLRGLHIGLLGGAIVR